MIYDAEKFADETGLIPRVAAETVIDEEGGLDPEQRKWFMNHADKRARALYSQNARWHKLINKENGRDFLYAFFRHWLQAFKLNPEKYKSEHPLEKLG